jgi:hypothetical protein
VGNVTVNFGEAYRYPTVTELYQNITVNGVATFANPLLKPEQDQTTTPMVIFAGRLGTTTIKYRATRRKPPATC